MTLNLVTEAKQVLFKSWSSRFGAAAAVLQALAEFQDQLPLIRDFIPHGVFSLLAVVCAIAVPLSRIVKQQALINSIAVAQTDPAAPAAPADPAPAPAPVVAPVAAMMVPAGSTVSTISQPVAPKMPPAVLPIVPIVPPAAKPVQRRSVEKRLPPKALVTK